MLIIIHILRMCRLIEVYAGTRIFQKIGVYAVFLLWFLPIHLHEIPDRMTNSKGKNITDQSVAEIELFLPQHAESFKKTFKEMQRKRNNGQSNASEQEKLRRLVADAKQNKKDGTTDKLFKAAENVGQHKSKEHRGNSGPNSNKI